MWERALPAAGSSHPTFSDSISQVVIISRSNIKAAPSVLPERNLGAGRGELCSEERQAFAFSCITLTFLEPRFKAIKHFRRLPGKRG